MATLPLRASTKPTRYIVATEAPNTLTGALARAAARAAACVLDAAALHSMQCRRRCTACMIATTTAPTAPQHHHHPAPPASAARSKRRRPAAHPAMHRLCHCWPPHCSSPHRRAVRTGQHTRMRPSSHYSLSTVCAAPDVQNPLLTFTGTKRARTRAPTLHLHLAQHGVAHAPQCMRSELCCSHEATAQHIPAVLRPNLLEHTCSTGCLGSTPSQDGQTPATQGALHTTPAPHHTGPTTIRSTTPG
jgi:hypothetical protein